MQYSNLARSNATIRRIEAVRGNPNFSVPPTMEQVNRHRDYHSTECPGNPFGEVPIVLGFRAEVLRQAHAHYADDILGSILAVFGWAKGPEYATSFGSAFTSAFACRAAAIGTVLTTSAWLGDAQAAGRTPGAAPPRIVPHAKALPYGGTTATVD